MQKRPLSFLVYWILVATTIPFIGGGSVAGRIVSAEAATDPVNYLPDASGPSEVAAEPAIGADTALAEAQPEYRQFGIASWYGARHQGRLTASGEIFDENKLTAAHRTLPLISWARVTNLENGRSVAVRVNDRGPYVEGRIIDLSTRAAEELGMTEQGLARVEVEVLPEQTASSAVE